MDQQQIIAGLEARAKAAGVSISAVCARAGIAASTFSRWKPSERNPHPIGATLKSLDKLGAAMSQIERERRDDLNRSIGEHERSPVGSLDSSAGETISAVNSGLANAQPSGFTADDRPFTGTIEGQSAPLGINESASTFGRPADEPELPIGTPDEPELPMAQGLAA